MYNAEQVKKTLVAFLEILNKHNVEYRFLGSTVIAAINGGLHRNLGDFDVILDKTKKDIVFEDLKKIGYRRAGGMFAFSRKYLALETLVHDELLSIGYFWGAWTKQGDFRMGNNLVSVQISNRALLPTPYSLGGLKFVGIEPRAIAVGIMTSSKNPKRKKEIEILQEKHIKPWTNNYIHIRVFGISCDWIYHGIMHIFNILGYFRVKFGLPFDPWRSKIH